MDKNNDGFLTSTDIERLTLQDLQAISNEVRTPHTSLWSAESKHVDEKRPECGYVQCAGVRISHGSL